MGAAGKSHGHVTFVNLDGPFALDEVAKQLRCIALLEAAQLPSQQGIERIGDQGHQHIEVELDQNGRRQRIIAVAGENL